MRAISSRTLVGELLPPMNWPVPLVFVEVTVVCPRKIPAFKSACALGSSIHVGMVLLGKGFPATIPAGGTPPGQFAPRLRTLLGTLMVTASAPVAGNTPPYSLVKGTV